ncbi:MAG: hypothetical protein KatS3mg023_0714 [Armatimonadota bacterium]|jgi:hypothetical protein|nr:MAG: hypothetical protein KatS3mg023_0714 [Armatimonadota bacterium]
MNNRYIPLSTEIENIVGAEVADAIYKAFTLGAEQTERQLYLAQHRQKWRRMLVSEALPVLQSTEPDAVSHTAKVAIRLLRWRLLGLEAPETRRERRLHFFYAVIQTWWALNESGTATISDAILSLLRSYPSLRPRRNEPYTDATEPAFLKMALKRFQRGVDDVLGALGQTPSEQRRTAENLLRHIAAVEECHPSVHVLHRGIWFDRATLEFLLAHRL